MLFDEMDIFPRDVQSINPEFKHKQRVIDRPFQIGDYAIFVYEICPLDLGLESSALDQLEHVIEDYPCPQIFISKSQTLQTTISLTHLNHKLASYTMWTFYQACEMPNRVEGCLVGPSSW